MNNQNGMDSAVEEILKSVNYMIKEALHQTTKIYDGVIVSSAANGKWNVKYNGEVHPVKQYGAGTPAVNSMVKVFIPQGNQALSWFLIQ